MEMKKCPSCGKDNLPDAVFCCYCGARFAAAVPSGKTLLTYYELKQEERAALSVNTVKTEPEEAPAKEKTKPSPAEDFEIEDGVLKKYRGMGGNVVIPEGVTSIGDKTFWFCKSLTGITIPDSVKDIGDLAFSECTSLKSVIIPGSVTSIGKNAFEACYSLTDIIIPACVSNIGEGTFIDCQSLRNISAETGNQHFCSVDGVLFDKDMTTIICFPAGKENLKYSIPEGVKNIGDWAFSGCKSLTEIIIPESVTSLGEGAFDECESLKDIIIPGSVRSIGDCAFSDCESLISVTIPGNVTSIGEWAFARCESLLSVTIQGNATSIGEGAFIFCLRLTVKCPAGSYAETYCKKNNINYETIG